MSVEVFRTHMHLYPFLWLYCSSHVNFEPSCRVLVGRYVFEATIEPKLKFQIQTLKYSRDLSVASSLFLGNINLLTSITGLETNAGVPSHVRKQFMLVDSKAKFVNPSPGGQRQRWVSNYIDNLYNSYHNFLRTSASRVLGANPEDASPQ